MNDQKSLFFAMALSIGMLALFNWYMDKPKEKPAIVTEVQSTYEGFGVKSDDNNVTKVIEKRVSFSNGKVHGAVSLKGAKIDEIVLDDYRQSIDISSDAIKVFDYSSVGNNKFMCSGWSGSQHPLPDQDSVWEYEPSSTEKNIKLSWNNKNGLIFQKEISLDDQYLFSIKDTVINNTDQTVTIQPFAFIGIIGTPNTLGQMILHEGGIAVFNNSLKEIQYSALQEKPLINLESTKSWIGFTDKYFLSAIVPNSSEKSVGSFKYIPLQKIDRYQADALFPPIAIEPMTTTAHSFNFFVGPKRMDLLEKYEQDLKIDHFDLAIDFGYLYFITKPIFLFLNFLNGLVGNFGLSILLLTIVVKLLFFPLANRSYKSMAGIKRMQPEVDRIKQRYQNDKTQLQRELVALYKKYSVNPALGCLPMLLQIPVFFALYKVLFVTIEMRHAPFFGWIQDLSAPDPTNLFTLFGVVQWGCPDSLKIGVWPILMGASMFLQQRLSPQPTDPMLAKMMTFMPLMFTFFMAQFSVGLLVYWTCSNMLSICQQYFINRNAKKSVQ